MSEFEPDRLFRRYLRERDVAALGALFDGAAPQLARVAWHLVHDAAEVEDLVQTTFLTALDSAEKFDARRRVMPWLIGILVNLARNSGRRAARHFDELTIDLVDPSRLEHEPERRELRDAVERAVAELPETYRQVVSTWLLEGASPGEIAARTGKPGATVRVQLHRGLELLRHGLPASVAALCASSGWSQGSTAGVRAAVLARASEVARTLVPTAVVIGGGLLMGTKLWLATAAVFAAAAVGVWWLARDAAEPAALASATPIEARGPGLLPDAAMLDPVVTRSEVPATVSAQVVDASVARAPGWWLVCDVIGDVGTEDARVWRGADERWSFTVQGAHFEIDLTKFLEGRPLTFLTYEFHYEHPRFMPASFEFAVPAEWGREDATSTVRFETSVECAVEPVILSVSGRVVVPDGADLTQVRVALFAFNERGEPRVLATETGWCAPDGSFRLRSPRDTRHALVALVPGLRPATCTLAAGQTGNIDLGTVVLEPGEHIAGRVHGSLGPGVVIASITDRGVQREVERPALDSSSATGAEHDSIVWTQDRFEWESLTAKRAADGSFRINGLAPCEYAVATVAVGTIAGGCSQNDDSAARVSFGAPAEAVRVTPSRDALELDARERVVGLDIRSRGAPVDGSTVRLSVGGRGVVFATLAGHRADLRWGGNERATVQISKDGWPPYEFIVTPADTLPGAVRIVDLR